MRSKIIDGKKYSKLLKEELKAKVFNMDIKPSLTVISVGDNAASRVYVRSKEKCANEIGINYQHLHYDEISEHDLCEVINKLNDDKQVHGIIVQLPLPKGMNENLIVNTIKPEKDVDGLTFVNAGYLLNNKKGLVSCTPKGIMYLLKKENVLLEGQNAVVIGRSILVGKPMMNLLINANATVTMCHSKTRDLAKITKKADILIVAIGQKEFIKRDMVKCGAVLIDVGINRVDGKLYGDVFFDDVYDKVSKITPVPGGVGPMTVVMLMENTIEACLNQIEKDK